MSKEMEKIRDELIDHIDKALVSKADQIPNSWSIVMQDLTRKIDGHIEMHEQDVQSIKSDIAELKNQTQWIRDTFAGGKVLGKISTITVKFLIFVTAVSGSILWLKDWLKK